MPNWRPKTRIAIMMTSQFGLVVPFKPVQHSKFTYRWNHALPVEVLFVETRCEACKSQRLEEAPPLRDIAAKRCGIVHLSIQVLGALG